MKAGTYYALNRERCLTVAKEYRNNNKERCRKRVEAWYAKNGKAYYKAWYAEHKTEKGERSKRYYSEHRNERLAYNRRYAAEHPDKVRFLNLNWWLRNEGYNRLRYAKERHKHMRRTAEISDSYVKRQLTRDGIDITPANIELCRKRLQRHRAKRFLKLLAAASVLSNLSPT